MLTPEKNAEIREARALAFTMSEMRKNRRKFGGELMRSLKAHIEHVPAAVNHRWHRSSGGTIVWKFQHENTEDDVRAHRNVIKVSVALQHPNDQYSRDEGRYCATTRMHAGQYILMYVPTDLETNKIGPWLVRALFDR